MKFLIVDLNIKLDGHRYGFMSNLIQYVEKHRSQDEFVFLSNKSNDFELQTNVNFVKTIQLNENEQQEISEKSSIVGKAKVEWEVIKKYATQYEIDRAVLMYFDTYQLEIGKEQSPFKISGIWFIPYPRIEAEGGGLKDRLKVQITKIRKELTMKWALRNQSLDKVFILNDEQMPSWLNKGKSRFFTLPDPYFSYDMMPDFDLRAKYGIPKDNLIFLQFGFIDGRKNIENNINAFVQLPEEFAFRSTLLVIGKFEEGYDRYLKTLIPEDSYCQIIFRNEFIPDEEMESTFAQSDVILRMNRGFFGSSGIMGIAAKYNKPLIGSEKGLLAELIRDYNLGKLINPLNINEISESISSFFTDEASLKINGRKYRDSHSLEAFASTLLRA